MEEIKLSVVDDFVRIMKGNISGGLWLALLAFSVLAIILSIYVQYKRTGKLNPTTPERFSLFYAVVDNLYRIVAGLIVMFIIFRLGSIFMNPSWFENEDMSLLLAVAVGFFISLGVDNAILWLQKKADILQTPNITVTKKEQQ